MQYEVPEEWVINHIKGDTLRVYKRILHFSDGIVKVKETQESTVSMLTAIATTYRNRTGKPIEEEKLLHKISEVEKIGRIKSNMAHNQDEPTQIWKIQVALRKNFNIAIDKIN